MRDALVQDVLLLVGMYFVIWVYFFVIDYWYQGNSFGKKKARIDINKPLRKKNFSYSFVHSLLKTIALLLWIISLIYFLITNGNLFYDKLLSAKQMT
jgi:hypothetical protein